MSSDRTPEALAAALDEYAERFEDEYKFGTYPANLRDAAVALRRLAARCAALEQQMDSDARTIAAADAGLLKLAARCAALEQEQAEREVARTFASALLARVDVLVEREPVYDEALVELAVDLAHETLRPGFKKELAAALSTPSEEPQR